ncbi:MAG: zinc ribbon domain-containing protein [Oscillospiraceae bacterium]|nr:zinc ribbon domain-containing protein [Oscillospiraceae bacterium]
MKKVFSIFLLVLMISAFSITSNALQEEVFIYNGEISIHVPEGYYSLEKNIPEDSEKLKELGITKEDFLLNLGDAEHLLVTEDLNTQIYIYCEKTDYIPLEFYTEPERTEYISELRKSYKERGCDVLEAEIESTYETIFTKISIASTEDYFPAIIYNTVYNELDVTVLLIYFGDGEISDAQEWTVSSLVNELEFNNNNYALKNTTSVEYTVDGIGTKLTFPKGWFLYENFDSKLIAVKSRKVAMQYFTYDVWDVFTEEQKSQMHRSKLDMDLFTEEDLKELIESEERKEEFLSLGMNIVEDSMQMIKIGNYNCVLWKAEAEEEDSIYKEATAIMYIENAIEHTFLFTGPFSEKISEEYKEIVTSAKFPEIPDEGGEKADEEEALLTKLVTVVGICVIVGAVFGAMVFAAKKVKDKKAKTDSGVRVSEERKFCNECGAQVEKEDKFCPLCGAKIKR